ncbi:MAG: SRPBCC family protein [Bacteroidales bacterium]|jgi:carbon monoxide dehydrogenase subunit G|nr:SRPBCC family protein [Bacteroidales bacterium]
MEVKVESKIGRLRSSDDRIYAFLSDCNNFQFAVNEKVKNWQSDSESCSFTVDGAGDVAFRIVERHPNDLVKFSIENAHAENIFLWVQLKNANPGDTRVKLTAKLDVNPLIRMLISKPLKQGLDKIVETLENVC